MKNRVTSGALRALVMVGAWCVVGAAAAQSGVGTATPDADKALHVRATATQDPLRLEGLNAGTTEEDVLVTDADGVLRYRPIADLTVSGEWRDSVIAGQALIFANQALGNGTSALLTDAGFLGVGMGTGSVPAYSLDVNGTAAVRTLPAGDVDRAGADDYVVTAHPTTGQLRGVDVADLVPEGEWVDDASGAYVYARRAEADGNDVVVTDDGNVGIGTTTPDIALAIDGVNDIDATGGSGGLRLRNGNSRLVMDDNEIARYRNGAPWNLLLQKDGGNLQVGSTSDPGSELIIYKEIRAFNLPAGDVDGSAPDDDIVTVTPTGYLRRTPVGDFSEWQNSASDTYVYARRAEAAGNNVVVTDAGRIGIGTTSPGAPLTIDGAPDATATGNGGALRIVRGSNVLLIDDNEIQRYTGSSPSQLSLQRDGGTVSVGASSPATSLLYAYGRVQVGDLPAGDVDGAAPDDEIVTADASGNLRSVAVADFSEWQNDPTDTYVYARRAAAAGNDVVVTDAGAFGIGTTTPRAALEVDQGGAVLVRDGGTVHGTIDPDESLRLAGTSSDVVMSTNDGTGRFNVKWNATHGTNEDFLVGGEHAVKLTMGGIASAGSDVFVVQQSAATGAAGGNVTWSPRFAIQNDGNVGIGTNAPTQRLDVDGGARVRTLPAGTVSDDPINTDQLVTADVNGNLRQVRPDVFFDDVGEWSNHSSNTYIYARRALEDAPSHNVVVSTEGELGLGLTNPTSKIHLDNAGMRINDYTWGIGFQGESPFGTDAASRDGARLYPDQNFFGGNQDAFVIEKTDFNNPAVDGGIAFTTRETTNARFSTMVIRGDGDVGIGVNLTNPTERLHVLGNGLFQTGGTGSGADGGLVKVVDDVTLPTGYTRGVQVADNGEYVYLGLEDRSVGHDAMLMWGNGGAQDFHFVSYAGGVNREMVTLDGGTLRVGIGATNPQRDLHVGGQVRVDDLYALTGDVDGTNPDDRLVTVEADGDLRSISATALFQDFEDEDWVINGNEIYNANSGDVGIGTTTPDTKLNVDGTVRLDGANVLQFRDNDSRIYSSNADDLDLYAADQTIFRRNAASGANPLVVDHNGRSVGIGVDNPGNAYALEAEGLARLRNQSELRFGGDDDNMIYAASNTDFRVTAQTLWSVRSRGDGTGVLSVRADQRRVGIGLNNPAVGFEVAERVRFTDLPNGDEDNDFFVTADADGDLRQVQLSDFEGPWATTAGSPDLTYLRNTTDHVGIGTSSPTSTFHVYEAVGTPATAQRGSITIEHGDTDGQSSIVFKSRNNNNNDYAYLNYHDDNPDLATGGTQQSLLEIGAGNNAGTSDRDDIALMPSNFVGIKTRAPTAELDVDGALRVRAIPDVSDLTDFAITVDADGNFRRQPINLVKDNLGDHLMRDELTADGYAISYDGSDAGIKLTAQNSTMLSNRLQVGSINPAWIDDPISGVTDGFHGNDAAFFAPVRIGTQSDLRLYVTDNNTDLFSIWGNPCGSADCGNINGSSPVVRFFAGGDVDVEALAHGGGTDLIVLADASGTLKLGPDPATLSGGGGSADNLGDHTATTNIILGANRVTRTGAASTGFGIDANGNINQTPGRGIIWGNLFGTAITGRVDANTDGTAEDLRFESDDDIWFDADGANGDFLVQTNSDVAFAVDDGYRFSAGTGANDDYRFYVNSGGNNPTNTLAGTNGTEAFRIQQDGEVQVFDLAGTGSALVGVNAAGELERVSTSSDGLWDRDATNGETYLRNPTDEVGIGTANPVAALHVEQADNAAPVEVRVNNDIANGDAALYFQENGSETAGMRFLYDGGDNKLYLEQGDGTHYVTFERGNGHVGIGAANPVVELHVARKAAAGAQSGLDGPARLRVANEVNQGSAGVELFEADGNGMTARYHSTADGSDNHFEIVRGGVGETNPTRVHLRIRRDNGEVTLRALGTGGADEIVVADANGLLSTRAFDQALWAQDATDSEIFLDPAVDAFQVGIGTDAPQAKLHVDGTVRVGTFGTGASTDAVVTVDANGDLRSRPASDFANFWERDASGPTDYVYTATTADFVGIGETAPQAKLDVAGDLRVQTLAAGTAGTDAFVVADAAGTLRQVPASTFANYWARASNAGVDYVELANVGDRVGIGTSILPEADLEVDGTVRLSALVSDATATGEVVMADADGDLFTQPLPAEVWTESGTDTYLSNSSNDVGIGTSSPQAKLHLASGTIRLDDINSTTGLATDRVLVADANGDVKSVPAGTFDSYWVYETANDELYQKSLTSFVGIGTSDPRSPLHVSRAGGSSGLANPVELQIQNRTGGGTAALRFRDNASTGATADNYNSMSIRWRGDRNYLEFANGSDSTFFRMRRQNGRAAFGYNLAANFNPPEQLYVQGDIGLHDGGDIQFAEANSYLRDNGVAGGADGDVVLRAADQLYLRGGANQGIRVNNNGTLVFEDVPTNNAAAQVLMLDGTNVRRTAASNLDDQTLTWNNGTGVLGISNGNTVNLSTSAAIDDQQLTLSGNTLQLTNSSSVNLAAYLDNTDAQDLTEAAGVLSLTGDGTAVDLTGVAEIDDQQLTISGSTLSLTNGGSVTLPADVDTDDQGLVLTGNTLTIEDGTGSIDLGAYLDNTDAQALAYDDATGLLTVSGGAGSIDLGAEPTIDDQTLTWTEATRTLSIRDGNDVVLTGTTAEWEYDATGAHVFAKRAGAGGADVVVTDAGAIGIGTTDPRGSIHLVDSGLVVGYAPLSGPFSRYEALRMTGPLSDAQINVQDGSGRFNVKWNASHGGASTFLAGGEHAIHVRIDGDPVVGGQAFEVLQSSATGAAGDVIPWVTRFAIDNDGEVGIGTADPTATLDVDGDARLRALPDAPTSTGGFFDLIVDASGVVYRGDPYATGAVTSDRRLKRDVEPFGDVLEQLDLLETVTYRYRDDVSDYTGALDTAVHYGIIAQDVAAAFPHAVAERADGYLGVKPNELIGVLLAVAKDLKLRNENLEEQVYHMMHDKADLEREVDGLRAQTAELESNVATVLEYVRSQSQVETGDDD